MNPDSSNQSGYLKLEDQFVDALVHIGRSNPADLIKQYESVCQRLYDDMSRKAASAASHGTGSRYLELSHIRHETDMWNLLWMLVEDRMNEKQRKADREERKRKAILQLQNQLSKSNAMVENITPMEPMPYTLDDQLALMDALETDDEFREMLLFLKWLETTYFIGQPHLNVVSAASSLDLNGRTMAPEANSDEKQASTSTQSSADLNVTKQVFKLIRGGRIEKACNLLIESGQAARVPTLIAAARLTSSFTDANFLNQDTTSPLEFLSHYGVEDYPFDLKKLSGPIRRISKRKAKASKLDFQHGILNPKSWLLDAYFGASSALLQHSDKKTYHSSQKPQIDDMDTNLQPIENDASIPNSSKGLGSHHTYNQNIYEAAIYGTCSGRLDAMLEACTSWKDFVWAHIVFWCFQRRNQHFEANPLLWATPNTFNFYELNNGVDQMNGHEISSKSVHLDTNDDFSLRLLLDKHLHSTLSNSFEAGITDSSSTSWKYGSTSILESVADFNLHLHAIGPERGTSSTSTTQQLNVISRSASSHDHLVLQPNKHVSASSWVSCSKQPTNSDHHQTSSSFTDFHRNTHSSSNTALGSESLDFLIAKALNPTGGAGTTSWKFEPSKTTFPKPKDASSSGGFGSISSIQILSDLFSWLDNGVSSMNKSSNQNNSVSNINQNLSSSLSSSSSLTEKLTLISKEAQDPFHIILSFIVTSSWKQLVNYLHSLTVIESNQSTPSFIKEINDSSANFPISSMSRFAANLIIVLQTTFPYFYAKESQPNPSDSIAFGSSSDQANEEDSTPKKHSYFLATSVEQVLIMNPVGGTMEDIDVTFDEDMITQATEVIRRYLLSLMNDQISCTSFLAHYCSRMPPGMEDAGIDIYVKYLRRIKETRDREECLAKAVEAGLDAILIAQLLVEDVILHPTATSSTPTSKKPVTLSLQSSRGRQLLPEAASSKHHTLQSRWNQQQQQDGVKYPLLSVPIPASSTSSDLTGDLHFSKMELTVPEEDMERIQALEWLSLKPDLSSSINGLEQQQLLCLEHANAMNRAFLLKENISSSILLAKTVVNIIPGLLSIFDSNSNTLDQHSPEFLEILRHLEHQDVEEDVFNKKSQPNGHIVIDGDESDTHDDDDELSHDDKLETKKQEQQTQNLQKIHAILKEFHSVHLYLHAMQSFHRWKALSLNYSSDQAVLLEQAKDDAIQQLLNAIRMPGSILFDVGYDQLSQQSSMVHQDNDDDERILQLRLVKASIITNLYLMTMSLLIDSKMHHEMMALSVDLSNEERMDYKWMPKAAIRHILDSVQSAAVNILKEFSADSIH